MTIETIISKLTKINATLENVYNDSTLGDIPPIREELAEIIKAVEDLADDFEQMKSDLREYS